MEYPIYAGLDTTDARDWRDELWSHARAPESSAGLPPGEQRELLEPMIERLLRHVQSVEEKGHGGQAALGFQVLAVMLLEAGCSLSNAHRQALLEGIAADVAGQGSPQGTDNAARLHRQNAQVLRDALMAYDLAGGTPCVLPSFPSAGARPASSSTERPRDDSSWPREQQPPRQHPNPRKPFHGKGGGHGHRGPMTGNVASSPGNGGPANGPQGPKGQQRGPKGPHTARRGKGPRRGPPSGGGTPTEG